ncbi:18282_t:CDS:1, partial [Funneliformis geosporum]
VNIYELGKSVNKYEIKAFSINGIGTEINKEMGYKLYNEATGKGDIS